MSSLPDPAILQSARMGGRATALRPACGLALLCAGAVLAQEQPKTESAADGEPAHELAPMKVVASADAGAAGLLPAYAGGQVATGGRVGVLGTLDNMSSPFNLTSYTEELVENQQAASVGEVLLNDPAVRVARGFGNFQQVYLVRGLPIFSDDMSYNGLYGLLPRQYLGAELVERVEVLRGANAFLNGASPGGSGLGGAVNVLPKRAPNEALNQVTAGIQTGGQGYGAFDVARRYQDEQLGLRLNGALRGGDTAVDGESVGLGLIALGVDWHNENVRLSADLGYQNLQRDASQPNITIAPGLSVPDAPNASVSVAQPWTFSDEEDFFGVVRGEYDFSENWTAWAAVGTRQGDEENSLANPTVIAADGTTSSFRFDNVREDSVWTGEIGVRGKVTTGPAEHQLSLSATAFHSEEKNAYGFSDFAGFAGNIYDPFDVAPPPADFFTGGDMDHPRKVGKVYTSSIALADMVSLLDEQLILTGGLRYQMLENYSYDYNTGDETAGYDDSALTPVAGILYKVNRNVSPYFNYIEGLNKGDVAPANSPTGPVPNAGEALAPYTTQQFETGVKLDFGKVGGAVSLFQTEKPIAGFNSDNVFEEIDDQRYRGLELTAYGEPAKGVRVLGGVSFLDTERDDLDQIGAPNAQLNIGSEWDLPFVPGLTVDGRVLYTDSQFADTANTQKVPSWVRVDLGLRYTTEVFTDNSITFRARVENVADSDYWASAGGFPGFGYLTVGAPRTLVLSATYEF